MLWAHLPTYPWASRLPLRESTLHQLLPILSSYPKPSYFCIHNLLWLLAFQGLNQKTKDYSFLIPRLSPLLHSAPIYNSGPGWSNQSDQIPHFPNTCPTQTEKKHFKGCTLEDNRGDLEIIIFKVKHYQLFWFDQEGGPSSSCSINDLLGQEGRKCSCLLSVLLIN